MATPPTERHLLTVREGHSETTYVLDASAYSIGRDPNCAIVLGSKSISRRHAILLRTPNPKGGGYHYRIIDGDAQGRPSANGIQVNHKPCKEKQLDHQDHIIFGGLDEVQAQYRIEMVSDPSTDPGLRIAQFRSLKKQDSDSLPTIAGDDVVFESGIITQLEGGEDDGKIWIELPEKGIITAPIHMPQVLATLRVGDRVNVTHFEGSYMFLGKLDSPGEGQTIGENHSAVPHALLNKVPTRSRRPIVLDPPQVPTLQGQGTALPQSLKKEIERKVQLYRRCYEAVVREMGDLQLKEEHYITIAGQILSSIDVSSFVFSNPSSEETQARGPHSQG